VDAALAGIAAGARFNAFITVCADAARAEADAMDAAWRHGEDLPPLFGVPFSVKDLTPTAGIRTTSRSRLFADAVPAADAIAVARMKAAGAILVGKTTTPEFGHKPFTEAPLFGRTLNPWSAAVTCGGSSGGAAVAVLTGMGPLALGTDGGGSIRIPAACCGVVGLKATLSAVPNLQVADPFGANSYVGPLARTVPEVALAWRVLRGADAADPWGQATLPDRPAWPLRGLRVAWLPRCGSPAIDPEVAAATEAAARRLATLGAVVVEVDLDFHALEPAFLVILESGFAARFREGFANTAPLLDPTLVRTIEKGLRHSAVALQDASAARGKMFRRLQALFTRHDLLLSPTLTAPPLPVDTDPHGGIIIDGKDAGAIRGAWYPFTFPVNLTGHPALAMPCGMTRDGLPIAGPWHGEETILATAEALESALPKLPWPSG
jgi:aspartyl-tRNA(Asn)/glutamyl-tRNA(Gln) amidotransferase subunit A